MFNTRFHCRLCVVVHVLFETLTFFLAADDNGNKDFSIQKEVKEDTARTVLHLVHYFAQQRVTINKVQFEIYSGQSFIIRVVMCLHYIKTTTR